MNYKKILWFSRREKFDLDGLYESLQPRRVVSEHTRYDSGTIPSEKCGRDIQHESGLEKKYIKLLEKNKRILFYWDQPVQIKYRAGRHPHFYTPDYGLYLDTHEIVITEVKSLADMLDYRVQRKIEALMEFCSSRGFGLLLTDGRYTPDQLLKGKVNRKLEKELLVALNTGTIRRERCREIMTMTGATQTELYRAIIRHNLKYRPFPLSISRGKIDSVFSEVYFKKKRYDEITKEKFPTLFRTSR